MQLNLEDSHALCSRVAVDEDVDEDVKDGGFEVSDAVDVDLVTRYLTLFLTDSCKL